MCSPLLRCALPLLAVLASTCDRGSPAPDGGAAERACDPYMPETCEAACDRGDGAACRGAAEALELHDGPSAVGLYEKACQRGVADTCVRVWSKLKENPGTVDRARAAAEKGCELGDAHLCLSAARANLGIDGEKTRKWRDLACQPGPDASHEGGARKDGCAALDDALVQRAAEARAACDRGEPRACGDLGDILLGAGEELRSAEVYGKSCAGRGFKETASIERCVNALRGRGGAPPRHPDPMAEPLRTAAEEGRIGLISAGDGGAGASDAGAPAKPLPPGVRPRVRVDKLSRANQPIATALTKAIRTLEPELHACYARGLARQPRLQGRIAVKLVFDLLGEASNVGNGGSDLPDPGVVSCVVRVVYRLRLDPPPTEITPVLLPLLFSPS